MIGIKCLEACNYCHCGDYENKLMFVSQVYQCSFDNCHVFCLYIPQRQIEINSGHNNSWAFVYNIIAGCMVCNACMIASCALRREADGMGTGISYDGASIDMPCPGGFQIHEVGVKTVIA